MSLLIVPAVAVAQQNDQPRSQRPAQNRQSAADTPPAPAGAAEFKSFEEKLSYVLGVNTARRMQQDQIDPDPQAFARGFIDSFTKEKPLLSDEEMTDVLNEFRAQLQAKAEQEQKQLAEDWDAAFSKKPAGEPKSTESGIKYEVITQGKGKKPTESDVVVVHYVGKLKDGKVFDSSIARGEPAVFPLNGVIAGWTEGLQLMPVGSKYRFQIPSELAYGEKGYEPAIPPNSDLTFEIELLDIAPAQGPAQGQAPAEEAPAEPQE